MLRKIIAFLAAPLPAALFQSVVVALWPKPTMGVFEHPASMFVAICLLFYLFGLIVGIPAYFMLRRTVQRPQLRYPLAGLMATLAPIAIAMAWGVKGQLSAYIITYNLIFFSLGGLLAGAIYRCIALRGGRAADVRG